MLIKVTLMTVIVLYAFALGQRFLYSLVFATTTNKMEIATYIQLRKFVDRRIEASLMVIHVILLAISIDLVAFCVVNPAGLLFHCSLISLVLLIADIVLLVKGNMPLSKRIDKWTVSLHPDNWKKITAKLLLLCYIRHALHMMGFIALLTGTLFGM